MNFTIREIQKQEYPLLDHFLKYEAIFVPDDIRLSHKAIINAPELRVYAECLLNPKIEMELLSI